MAMNQSLNWDRIYSVKSMFFSLSSKLLIDFVTFEAAATSRSKENDIKIIKI